MIKKPKTKLFVPINKSNRREVKMTKPETMIIDDVKYVRADKVEPEIDGEFVIIRCDRSGVFAGIIIEENGNLAKVKNARRLWYWSGAASLSQLAMDGTSKPNDCKFPIAVPEIRLKDVIEIIPCTKKARQSIESVKTWSV